MSKHWHSEKDPNGAVWLHFDMADSGTNVLSSQVLEELDAQIRALALTHPTALVIVSDKKNGFIAGADVSEFTRLKGKGSAENHIRRAHGIFSRIEAMSFPTLALIKGFCLGGGLELALACRYRIACDDGSTRLGFPEVRLGIFPGFGGTVRSTRLLGALPAMNLMLSGRTLSARAARRLGLVDMAVPERQLEAAARELLAQPPKPRRPTWMQQAAGSALLRPLLAWQMRRKVAQRVNLEHYPAPDALIDHWERFAGKPVEMYANEARAVSDLLTGETAQNLVRVFFLQERLKTLAQGAGFKPRRVHVVGGGIMGGDIAAWCALRGLNVTLQDRAPEYLSRAFARAHKLFRSKLKRPNEIQAAADRLVPDHKGYGAKKADVVIEAIFEDVEAKQALYRELEPQIGPDTLLATNTSSIPLEVLSEALERPGRLVGLHFFNPVAKMQLIEIVTTETTEADVAAQAASFARRIDRLPLPVKSSPGFLVNRVLMPYLIEAVNLLEEGVPAPVIDSAAVDFGMPMGPVELADTVGLDICLSVAEKLSEHFPMKVPERLRSLVREKHLGRKTGEGFYRYKNERPVRETPDRDYQPPPDLAERMIFRLLNESVACLREGVVENADLLDAGIIYGTGFAPFRGGPMHYINSGGEEQMRSRLRQLEQQHGKAFSEDPGWASLGKA